MQSKKLEEVFAFSIQAKDAGWTWQVYDLEGVVVAEGYSSTKVEAHAAVGRVYGHKPAAEGASARLAWG